MFPWRSTYPSWSNLVAFSVRPSVRSVLSLLRGSPSVARWLAFKAGQTVHALVLNKRYGSAGLNLHYSCHIVTYLGHPRKSSTTGISVRPSKAWVASSDLTS